MIQERSPLQIEIDRLQSDPMYEDYVDMAIDDMSGAAEEDRITLVSSTYERVALNMLIVPMTDRMWWSFLAGSLIANIRRIRSRRWPISRRSHIILLAIAIKDVAQYTIEYKGSP